jgi:hypothetical protein
MIDAHPLVVAKEEAPPQQSWAELDVAQIVAAEHLACEGPAPDSLLPLAVCLQVCMFCFDSAVSI